MHQTPKPEANETETAAGGRVPRKSAKTAQLRHCFVVLSSNSVGTTEELPRVLGREARGVLARVRGWSDIEPAAVEDLVGEFLGHLVKLGARRGGLQAVTREWLAWPDARLVGTVRRVMRNLAVEESPHWDLVRCLRAMVKSALEKGLPIADVLPETLLVNGRLEMGRVARACAWVAANPPEGIPQGAASATWLADGLWSHYQLGQGPAPKTEVETERATLQPEDTENGNPELELGLRRGAAMLAEQFLAERGLEAGELLVRRCNGEGFEGLAARFRVAVATVHARAMSAFKTFGALAKVNDTSREEAQAAIEALRIRLSPFLTP